MASERNLNDKLLDILEIARYAPSVHNTQPWIVSAANNTISVRIDTKHALTQSDPTGRETIISLGIFCEAIVIAVGAAGYSIKGTGLLKGGAEIEVATAKVVLVDPSEVSSLKTRCTDRSIYKPATLTAENIAKIENSSRFPGVKVVVKTDTSVIHKVAELTAKGISLALSNPLFRKELSGYLTLPWGGKRGISVLSLGLPLPMAVLEPWLIRWGIGLKTEVKTEKKRWLSASGIIFITTAGDIDADWFRAGRAYLRASLSAELLGLAQATSAAAVEASSFHEDVEELLDTKQRLQSAIRLGKSARKKAYSPRLSASDLLAT